MSNITPPLPTTPADKLAQMQSNLTSVLQQLNSNTLTPDPTTGQPSMHLNQTQLSDILQCFRQQQDAIQTMIDTTFNTAASSNSSSIRPSPTTTALPEYYNNAKYEDLVCKPIKPLYDGSPEHLVPFLNRLDI